MKNSKRLDALIDGFHILLNKALKQSFSSAREKIFSRCKRIASRISKLTK